MNLMSLGNKKRQDNDTQRQNIKKVSQRSVTTSRSISIQANTIKETIKEIRSIFEDVNEDIKECFIR